MEKTDKRYQAYVDILREELIPAMGCTEPIAVAYAAAKARDVLGAQLEDITEVRLQVSGSIIKNVKSVIVPNTDHSKGLKAAVAIGLAAGITEKKLEVIASADPAQTELMKQLLNTLNITVEHIELGPVFDIIVTLKAGEHYSRVRISEYHTRIVLIEKDGETLLSLNEESAGNEVDEKRKLLDMEGIWDFAQTADLDDVRDLLEPQVRCNMAIAEEGLKGNYGSNIGRTILEIYGSDIRSRAKAKAAAGSDARMNGCEMPVVINSGSGNQGITCSVPVIEYAREYGSGEEKMLRALLVSDLTTIHQKTGIGTLSAYCGAVCAAAGAGAGIVYLHGGNVETAKETVINALGTVSGIVCDGAKASCAAKIAMALEAALLGYEMCVRGHSYNPGDGIIMKDAEETIDAVGILGREGMRETNDKILDLMIRF